MTSFLEMPKHLIVDEILPRVRCFASLCSFMKTCKSAKEMGADPVLQARCFLESGDLLLNDPLFVAVEKGSSAEVTRLLLLWSGARADVNRRDWLFRTPLYVAATNGRDDVVRVLLEAGADVFSFKFGYKIASALHGAAAEGHAGVLRALLDAVIANNDTKKDDDFVDRGDLISCWTALHYAAAKGHAEAVRVLLYYSPIPVVDVNCVNNVDQTPLHLAASGGYIEVLRLLLDEARIDVNCVDWTDATALHTAVSGGQVEALRVLLNDARVKVDLVDCRGQTALHHAADHGRVEVVRLLLVDGRIDVCHRDRDGKTALHLAADHGHVEVVRMLLRNGSTRRSGVCVCASSSPS